VGLLVDSALPSPIESRIATLDGDFV
jgi:hypothetical protein